MAGWSVRWGSRQWIAACVVPLAATALGAIGAATAVAVRYAPVRRVDNAVSMWIAAAAAVGGVVTVALLGVFLLAARSAPRRWWLVGVPAAAVGGLLWRAVPEPPKGALTVGFYVAWFLLLASPALLVGVIFVGIVGVASLADRRLGRSR